jgi:hypothetical protein
MGGGEEASPFLIKGLCVGDELAREVREKGKVLEYRVSHLYPSTQVYDPDAAVRSLPLNSDSV